MPSGAPPRRLPAGDGALLLEFADRAQLTAAYRYLDANRPDGLLELVPAAGTLLLLCEPALIGSDRLTAAIERAAAIDQTAVAEPAAAAEVVVPVLYNGPDLEEVAALTGLSVAEVVDIHASARYTVAFCGFVPGFGYLEGLDPRLVVPRLGTPRTRVPAGSVAIADDYTGVYPAASPGGWRWIGRTDVGLWNLEREPPALLAPGTRVRFEPLGDAHPRRTVHAKAERP